MLRPRKTAAKKRIRKKIKRKLTPEAEAEIGKAIHELFMRTCVYYDAPFDGVHD